MEELIKYCSEHNYQIGFNITDKKYVIDFIITRKNYHILCDLFRELEYIYLCDINPSIYYDHNTGIKISLTVRKEIDKEDLFKNIIKILDNSFEITYPELILENVFNIVDYLKRIGVNRVKATPIEDVFSMTIIHHKNIKMPEIISEDPCTIKEYKGNYEKDYLPILDYDNIEKIVNEMYHPREKNKKQEKRKIFKWMQ